MQRNFRELLEAQWDEKKFLCIGLDTDIEKIPGHMRSIGAHECITAFNRAIIDATKDVAGSYKPNSAFYEAHGDEGWSALCETVEYIREQAPGVPVILDAKRGDIGNTNKGYIDAAFERMSADAITVSPYMGGESLAPFLELKDKGIIVLCRTSNPGAGEFQDMKVDGEPLYKAVARRVAGEWNGNGNCAVVVGATYPGELSEVRAIVGDMPILIPGIGVQGGDLEKTVHAGKDGRGRGMMIAASRAIIYASSGPDFAEAARAKAQELDGAIRNAL
jgi:orotidine-5'-phosphate decarboxylase